MSTFNEVNSETLAQLARLRALLERTDGEAAREAGPVCDTIAAAIDAAGEEIARLHEALDTESALRAQAQEFRRLMYEESPLSMAVATLAEGRFIDVNDTLLRRTGYAREDLIGRTSAEVGLWPKGAGRDAFVEKLKHAGTVDGLEITVRKQNGEFIPARFFARIINMSGVPCILSITQNLEERQRAEQESVRLRQFYEDLLAALPAHIAIVDTQGRYQYISPSALPEPEARDWLLDKTILEAIGRWGIDLATAERRQEFVDTVAVRKEVMQFEERIAGPTGEPQHYIRTYKPVLNDDGEVVRIIIYGLEITELRRLEEQLRQAQKMEAIGRLAGGVAHDFNNLLTAIMGTAELLLDKLDQPEALRNGIQDIQHASQRGASLTRQLLSFSRRQVIKLDSVDLNTVIRNMQDMIRRLIGEQILFSVDLAPSLPLVRADRNQLEQVLLNLAVNARDAMPRGGSLTIRTWQHRAAATGGIRDHQAPARPGATLAVTDTGCGMGPDVLPHIFEPFFTTKEEGKGTGLGLPTVYAIVEGCGGQIFVDTAEDCGTTVLVHLLAADPEVPSEGEHPRESATAPGTGTILVVEDEAVVRSVVERILVRSGYRVLVAHDGDHAIQLLQSQDAGPIDLLLTDMVMPGMSGRELVERVLTERPLMKVVLMSGHLEGEDADFIARQHSTRFLHKPFSSGDLIDKVRSSLDGR